MMRLLVAFSIFIAPLLSVAQMTDFTRQELPYVNVLAAFNGGFESGTAKWTASGGTFVSVTSGSNLLEGKVSTTWNSNGAAQTLTSQAVTVKNGYFGRDCEASIVAQVPSGTATHLVQAHDGTNVLAFATIVSSTQPRKNTLTFPCPSSGTYALRLLSVAADEPLIALDEAYLGLARNIGSTDLITEWEAWTPTGGWTGSVTYTGRKRRVGDQGEYNIKVATGGAPTGSSLTINMPSGETIDTSKMASAVASSNVVFGTGSVLDSGTRVYTAGVIYDTTTSVRIQAMGQAATNIDYGGVTPTSPMTFASGDTVDVFFSVPIVGWEASTTVMPDAQGWFAAGEISGANPSLGVASVTSYTEIANASLTLTPQSGSAPMGVMCSSTNAAATPSTGATTCSAGSESVGFNANFPRSGMYEICAEFAHQAEVDSGEGLRATFQVVQTPTNAQTLSQETGSKVTSGVTGMTIASGTSSVVNTPHTRCGFFNLSAGVNGFRLMYEQIVGGTPNTSTLLADASTNEGQRAIRWSAKPVSQQQQAILANSVSSANNNGTYFNSAQVGSTGTVTKETGDWISGSCSVSTAVATCTLVAGAFSTDPACHATIFGETTSYNAVVTSASTSTVVIRTFDTANAAAAAAFSLTCSSPR